jgi:hypothetical protein
MTLARDVRRIIVCGGRGYTDRQRVREVLDEYMPTDPLADEPTIVHGDARGADRLAASPAATGPPTWCVEPSARHPRQEGGLVMGQTDGRKKRLRTSMKHDKRGWHVIGRGDDRRVYGGPFDSANLLIDIDDDEVSAGLEREIATGDVVQGWAAGKVRYYLVDAPAVAEELGL